MDADWVKRVPLQLQRFIDQVQRRLLHHPALLFHPHMQGGKKKERRGTSAKALEREEMKNRGWNSERDQPTTCEALNKTEKLRGRVEHVLRSQSYTGDKTTTTKRKGKEKTVQKVNK